MPAFAGMTLGVEHRGGVVWLIRKHYGVDRLVYFERRDDAEVAARRERNMKRWRRDWKIELIEKNNPTWRDLFSDVLRDHGSADQAPCQFPLPGPRLYAAALCAGGSDRGRNWRALRAGREGCLWSPPTAQTQLGARPLPPVAATPLQRQALVEFGMLG